ncbi:MAG TPA: carboxypeptidase regulatory-like domain-containing protein [Terracidiphilus sp.]|nr:carboxypeptidase regulatory-like domain-containing protein [Terracidiphilus sp.]
MRFNRMKWAAFATAMLALLLSMCATPAAWSQLTSGDVVGSVLDKSGAVIGDATVTATNVATGVVTKTTADKLGEFRIPNLPAGTYNITATAPGFAVFTLKNFQVELNATATARMVLPVASASTSVEVSADSYAVIDTTTAQMQTTFQTEDMQVLPTAASGLGVLNLSLLVPGVASPGAVGDGTGPSVGGQRSRDNNYTIEGIDNNDKSVTGPLVYVPGDAVGEFTAITNQFSPEFGHSAGGQFNLTVKSGTNHMHGEAYEVMQNRNLNAENAVQGGKVPNPRYDNNRYGGQFGGPIKKDKLFYFVNFERNSVGQSGQYYICTPTAAGVAMLNTIPNLNPTNLGIMTQYSPVSPSQVDYNSDLACGSIAPTLDNPDPEQYVPVWDGTSSVQDPNTGYYEAGNEYDVPLGNYLVNAPNYNNFNALTTSGDWTISSKDSLRLRYIYNKYTGIDTAAELPAFFEPLPIPYHLIAISEYHNFTPNLINEARIGFNRYAQTYIVGSQSFPGLDQFPNIWLYDQGFLDIGPDGNAPQGTIQNLYQFTDNISWVKGKHTLKFGFDGRKFISPQSFTQRARGDYEWGGTTDYLHDLAVEAGLGFGERSTGNFNYYGDQTAFYGYVNDIYRISQKLTLNMGLRYEFTSIPEGEKVQALNSAASAPGLIVFNKPEPQKKNILPRFGINYAWSPNTSIRAGFGMADDVLYDNLGILSFPPQFSSTQDVGSGGQCGTVPCPDFGSPNFLANGGLLPGTGTLQTFDSIADQRAATSAFDPNQTVPYAETWNLGVEHVFAQKYTMEVRYVGTRGIHLPTQIQPNVAPQVTAANQLQTYMEAPSADELTSLTNTLSAISTNYILPAYDAAGFTSKITSYQPKSESNYNGLEAGLRRQFTNGLALNFAYTYSKTMDDATASVFSTVLTPRRPQNSQDVAADYSRSALDRTHRLTLVAIYDLPFFKNSNWMAKNLIGNWTIAPIYTYESPEYYTVLSGINSNMNGDSSQIDRTIYNASGKNGTGSAVTAYANPDLQGNCPAGSPQDPNLTYICSADTVAYVADNPNARYIVAGKGTLPTAERNTQGIQPINNIDATVVKKFSFGESRSLQFSVNAYNVLNHSQFVPGSIDGINSAGYTASSNFQTASNAFFNVPGHFFAANARSMQLSLKFAF